MKKKRAWVEVEVKVDVVEVVAKVEVGVEVALKVGVGVRVEVEEKVEMEAVVRLLTTKQSVRLQTPWVQENEPLAIRQIWRVPLLWDFCQDARRGRVCGTAFGFRHYWSPWVCA